MEFIYTDNINNYKKVLNTKIKECLCKHVMHLESGKSEDVYAESKSIGYDYVIWGHGENLEGDYSLNRTIQLYRIQNMIYKNLNNSLRIVIDCDGTIWIDNLHTAIRNIFELGEDVTIGDTKCYIVDFSKNSNIPTIVNIRGSLSDNLQDIKGMLEVSYDRLSRITSEIKNVHYTIQEFIDENQLYKEELTLFKENDDENNCL